MRRVQLASKWPDNDTERIHNNFDDNIPQAEGVDETNVDDEEIQPESYSRHLAGGSGKWPAYWTTFEGGYESDQRNSDKDPLPSSEDEDRNDTHVQKRRKKVAYPTFNEKIDMKSVELFVGLRFTSGEVFKEAILAYSIQQHQDLVYLKNDKKFISVGCAHCRWEITNLEDHTGWQIKSMQPVHEWCTKTFENRLITVNWLETMSTSKRKSSKCCPMFDE
uniref:Transposase MuDR plant domain-containing protein n=1 Tax=Chenopodium quinoa TaxID=63459 RepID=A0A803NA18_CHEQI